MELNKVYVLLLLAVGLLLTAKAKPAGAAAISGCSGCSSMKKAAMARRVRQIEAELLTKLGLVERPRLNGTELLPPKGKVRQLASKILAQAGQPASDQAMMNDRPLAEPSRPTLEKVYKTTKKVSAQDDSTRDWSAAPKPKRFDVEISKERAQWVLHNAYLYVPVDQPAGTNWSGTRRKLTVSIHEVDGTKRRHIVKSRKTANFTHASRHWLRVTLTKRAKEWFDELRSAESVSRTYRLDVVVTLKKKPLSNLVNAGADDETPYLELVAETGGVRQKRSLPDGCSESADGRPSCCLYPMEIDFEQLGYNFIIAPKRFNANICYGRCPRHFKQEYTHGEVVSQARAQQKAEREMRGGSAGDEEDEPGPCCHPTEYLSLTMVFTNQAGEVIAADVPGMVARGCGCA